MNRLYEGVNEQNLKAFYRFLDKLPTKNQSLAEMHRRQQGNRHGNAV